VEIGDDLSFVEKESGVDVLKEDRMPEQQKEVRFG